MHAAFSFCLLRSRVSATLSTRFEVVDSARAAIFIHTTISCQIKLVSNLTWWCSAALQGALQRAKEEAAIRKQKGTDLLAEAEAAAFGDDLGSSGAGGEAVAQDADAAFGAAKDSDPFFDRLQANPEVAAKLEEVRLRSQWCRIQWCTRCSVLWVLWDGYCGWARFV